SNLPVADDLSEHESETLADGVHGTDFDIHYVGESGEPSFQNGWENYGGDFSKAAFWKIGNMVYLQGLIRNGSNDVMFTLPSGYRPSKDRIIATISSNDIGRVAILPNGDIDSNSINSSSWVSLEGINFQIKE
ncbi:MAG: hypothetical protein ACOC44_20270, partial [Promethearchaeia archaeon]